MPTVRSVRCFSFVPGEAPGTPAAVKGAPLGSAKRTLDGEDGSATIPREGKPERVTR